LAGLCHSRFDVDYVGEPMSDATDELAEVLTDALVMTRLSDFAGTDLALIEGAVEEQVAALVERYGEPEIEEDRCVEPDCYERGHKPARRLVFPWQKVKE
jgi:hypothetical protein